MSNGPKPPVFADAGSRVDIIIISDNAKASVRFANLFFDLPRLTIIVDFPNHIRILGVQYTNRLSPGRTTSPKDLKSSNIINNSLFEAKL